MATWVPFPPRWFAFFKKRTGKVFNFSNVVGQCTSTADLYKSFLKKGKLQYGFFLGAVTHRRWGVAEFHRHGWLLVNDCIVDSARWCFNADERPRLCIALSTDPDYDLGMNRSKEKMLAPYRQDFPVYDPTRAVACKQKDLVRKFDGKVDIGRLFWIANRAPGSDAFTDDKERVRIFKWLQNNGHIAMIPWDNRV